jgi:hypothetical protein
VGRREMGEERQDRTRNPERERNHQNKIRGQLVLAASGRGLQKGDECGEREIGPHWESREKGRGTSAGRREIGPHSESREGEEPPEQNTRTTHASSQ